MCKSEAPAPPPFLWESINIFFDSRRWAKPSALPVARQQLGKSLCFLGFGRWVKRDITQQTAIQKPTMGNRLDTFGVLGAGGDNQPCPHPKTNEIYMLYTIFESGRNQTLHLPLFKNYENQNVFCICWGCVKPPPPLSSTTLDIHMFFDLRGWWSKLRQHTFEDS